MENLVILSAIIAFAGILYTAYEAVTHKSHSPKHH